MRPRPLDTFGVFPLTTVKKKSNPVAMNSAEDKSKRKSMKEAGLFRSVLAQEVADVLADIAAEKATHYSDSDYDTDCDYDEEESASFGMR